LRVRITPGAYMSVSCKCCVLSGTSLCDELITRPEGSYRVWCNRMSVIEGPHEGGLCPLGSVKA